MVIDGFFTFEEVALELGIPRDLLEHFVEMEWLLPAQSETQRLDVEDRARVRLICDLRDRMGINEEGISVVLHLIDQLHGLMSELEALRK